MTVGTPAVCPMGGGDCDDADASIHPNDGLAEICDGKDQNCDGAIDEGCDDDGDGYCDASLVVASTSACRNDCAQTLVPPAYVGSVRLFDTHRTVAATARTTTSTGTPRGPASPSIATTGRAPSSGPSTAGRAR